MVDDILAADDPLNAFLVAVYEKTSLAGVSQVSMYAVGEALGMGRSEAKRASEALIGLGLVEVRTLSGAIGLSADGVVAAGQLAGAGAATQDAAAHLGEGPIMSDADRRHIETMQGRLKCLAGDKSWAFDILADLMADLKTIDAQLMSSRPKTAIIRECLRSILGLLDAAGHKDVAGEVRRLLG